ncbi:diguanylate cyclase [Vibrio breoganii]|nr:diguanylate cyclase [Vibrio breoganii]PMK52766.1 diguanylate cyclase [Vibrio breoganii]PMK71945.1 diguanylate cyclase [Vibrio breoganii]PMM13064.1 diguanylate cyclase [Vibrio breoganii]
MKMRLRINSRNAILMGGFLLGAYLLLMITVTNAGQNRLKESQLNELNLKVKSYSESLSYFFDATTEDVKGVAKHKTTYTFFANLASGMSMEYGLGSSLLQLRRNLVRLTKPDTQLNTRALFDRMLLVGFKSNVIADSHPRLPFDVSRVPFDELSTADHKIDVLAKNDQIIIRVLQNVYFNGELVGVVVGDINLDVVVRLLTTQEYENSSSKLDLATPQGLLPIWNTFNSEGSPVNFEQGNTLYFDQEVEQTPFRLHASFEPVSESQIITSTWFTVGLSFLAVPVILGLYYSLRINNTNLVLTTKIEETHNQQAALTRQNERLKTEIDRRKMYEQELAYQATHDTLTRLSNRKSGDEKLRHALLQARREEMNVLVMFIDLDNFKQINDTLGHLAGDQILMQTAKRLKDSVRKTDVVARIGGDEFLLVIPNLNSEKQAQLLASKLLATFEDPFQLEASEFFVSTSIGMSIYPQDGENAEELMAHADTAMYRVKKEGRNGFSFYDSSMNTDVQRNLDIDARLRQAINQDELEMYYQPIIDLSTEQIIGAEALMRWNDEKLGFVSPEEFIPIAEKNGLIHKLGEIALHTACHQAQQWQSIQPLSIAVNFSAAQFRQKDTLMENILTALSNSGLESSLLDIEITESLLFNHTLETVRLFEEIKQLGAHLSIDDFGTGYSALSYLQKFPFSKLKIDRSFLQDMETTPSSQELVNAIIAMAKALGLKVVAEGVETQWDKDYLQRHSCEFAQGFYYSRPLTKEAFEALLLEQNNRTS